MEVMKNNEINKYGIRGCVVNVIGLQEKYDEKYFEEQDIFAKKMGETFESVDEKVEALAKELTRYRIRSNSIIVPSKSDLKDFSLLIQTIIEDQYIAGQIINFEDDFVPHLGSFADIFS